MDKLIIIKLGIITLLFASCSAESKNEGSDEPRHSKQDDNDSSFSGLITAYKLEIEKHYDNYRQNNRNTFPELQLEGEVSYEDEDFLILTFSEILEYGSWHYSNSSFVFRKLGDQNFEGIIPDKSDTITGPNLDQELAYEGRINGVPFYVGDLTGDQIKDFIFRSSTSVRSTNYNQYSFYTIKNNSLQKSTLKFSAEIDDGCGDIDSIRVDENFNPPVIIVKSRKIKCDPETGVKLSMPSSDNLVYQWNENEFINGQQIEEKLMAEIQSINDSISTLSNLGVVSVDMRGNLIQALTEVDKSERAFVREKIEINKKLGSIYDSLVNQIEKKGDRLDKIDDLIYPKNFKAVKENAVQIVD